MNLYHLIVRLMLRRGFAALNRSKDAAHIVASFTDRGTFAFATEGRFGGERTGRTAVAAWFGEIFDLFPDIRITPLAIVVDGWPWATRVATRLRIEATLYDGTPYVNEGMQFVKLRFGRITEDRVYEDSGKLERVLPAQVKAAARRRAGATTRS